MFSLDRWDVALLALVGYVAVITLARLMARDRDRLIGQLEEKAALERQRQAAEAKKLAQEQKKQQRQAA